MGKLKGWTKVEDTKYKKTWMSDSANHNTEVSVEYLKTGKSDTYGWYSTWRYVSNNHIYRAVLHLTYADAYADAMKFMRNFHDNPDIFIDKPIGAVIGGGYN